MFGDESSKVSAVRIASSVSFLYCVMILLCGCTLRSQKADVKLGDLLHERVASVIDQLDQAGAFAGPSPTIWMLEIESDHNRASLWVATLSNEGMYVRTYDCEFDPTDLSLRADRVYSTVSDDRFCAMAVTFVSEQPFIPGRDTWANTGGAFSGKHRIYKRTVSLQSDVENVLRRLSRGPDNDDAILDIDFPIELGMPSLIAHYYPAE